MIGNATVITLNVTKDNVLVDPIVLTFEYETPALTTVTYTYGVGTDITKVSTGVYQVILLLDQAGMWRYNWRSTNPNHGAVEGTLIVNPSIIV